MGTALVGAVSSPDVHVMTFNVRRDMKHLAWRPADRWDVRLPRLIALLRTERPGILGAQEALPGQASAIQAALGGTHRFVGHGRTAGRRGEACPLFYDAERFELLGWRQVALSDRPEEPGSVSWGNVIPRVYVVATLRDRATSNEFRVLNTHLDAFSARARLRAARELRRVVAASPLPTVVLGDLNSGPDSPPWRALQEDRILVDAWNAARRRLSPEWGTYSRYRRPVPGTRIDGILVSADVRVRDVAINGQRFQGGWPSDHLPVQVVLRFPRAGTSRTEEER